MLARDLKIIKAAAIEAGQIAHDYQRGAVQSWEKDDGQGPVSEADLAVNDFLKARFSTELPDCAILSEEDEDDPARLKAERLLVIDPIDGTKAFLDGSDYFCVSIGLLQNNAPVAGVVAAPALGDVYSAHSGGGAFCNDTRISVAKTERLEEATALASRAKYNREALDQVPAMKTEFRPSIALRLALVARGKFDMSIALRPSWDWDIAAGDCIVQEAGGVLLDRAGKPLKYNQDNPQQNGIVAGSAHLVEDFIKRIN